MTFLCGGSLTPVDVLRVLAGLTECCMEAVEEGPHMCTCWEPEYDAEQEPPDESIEPSTRSKMCDDCAYRPDSPERTGDEDYRSLDEVPATATFFCHQGIRRVARYRHATLGIVIDARTHTYVPPGRQRGRESVPYKADGKPADRCAGWAGQRAQQNDLVGMVARESAREVRGDPVGAPGDAEIEVITPGMLEVLSVGKGDIKLTIDGSNPEEVDRARRIIEEMLSKGYGIFVETDKGPQRVKKFNPKRMTYIVTEVVEPTETEARPKRTREREVPVAGSSAKAVGRTAGG